MHYEFLSILPSTAALIWALVVKARLGKSTDVWVLLALGLSATCNEVLLMLEGLGIWYSDATELLRSVACGLIVPLLYSYFSHQFFDTWNTQRVLHMFLLLLLLLIPNLTIVYGDSRLVPPETSQMFTVNVVRDGRIIYYLFMGDLIIVLQAIVTAFRVVPSIKQLRQHGLVIAPKTRWFLYWWVALIVFVIASSMLEAETLYTFPYNLIYNILLRGFSIFIFVFIALRFDANPIVTEDEHEEVNPQDYMARQHDMADHLQRLFLSHKLYQRQGLTIDEMAEMLGTNRTYLTRMMRACFNKSFVAYLTEERLIHAKQMLLDTDKPIAEVAEECGFSDSSSFARVFKDKLEMTPSEFRASSSK